MSETEKQFGRGKMSGKQLAAARAKLHLTQAQMYEKLSMPRRTYEDYEYGKRPIPGSVQRLVTLLVGKR